MSTGGVWVQAQRCGDQWWEAVHVRQRGLRASRSRQYVQQEAAGASFCAGGGGGGAGSMRSEPHGVRGCQRLGSLGLRGRWLRQTGARPHHHQGYSAGKRLSFVIMSRESLTARQCIMRTCLWAGFERGKKGLAWCTQEESYTKSISLNRLKSHNGHIKSFGSIANTKCSCTSKSVFFFRKIVQLSMTIFLNS